MPDDAPDSVETALNLAELGYHVIPITPGSKAATTKNWTQLRLTYRDIPHQFKIDNGVGLLLCTEVAPSTYVIGIDIDIDDPLLIERVKLVFPQEPPSKKGSKGITYFVRVEEPVKKRLLRRKDAVTGATINAVEILASGQQTVLPPSLHPKGMKYTWGRVSLLGVDPRTLPLLHRSAMHEIEIATSKPDSNIFLINTMEPSSPGEPGTIHNSCLTTVASLVGHEWSDDEIWARIRLSLLRIVPDRIDEWEPKIYKMVADARTKGFDQVDGGKKDKDYDPELEPVYIAQWFINEWRGKDRVFIRDGRVMHYDGGYYKTLTTEDLIYVIANEWRNQMLDIRDWRTAASTIIGRGPRFPTYNPKRKVAFENQITFDMDTGEAGSWSPDDYLISRLPFEYDPRATCPTYEKFADRTFRTEDSLEDTDVSIACFEEFLAMTMFECLDYHKFLIIKGAPRSGKSTLLNIAQMMHARDAISSVGVQDFGSEHHRTFMLGKLLNLVSEVAATTHTSDDFLKAVVAGDLVQVRHLYQAPMSVRLPTRIMIACNEMFRVRDTSGAIEERMVMLTCDNVVPERERDPNLTAKLRAEAPGIFNRLARAWQNLKKRGYFVTPASHDEAVSKFTEENNHVLSWLRERTHQGIKHFDPEYQLPKDLPDTEVGMLYLDFVGFCQNNGYKQVTSNTFGMKLAQLRLPGISGNAKLKRVGGVPVRVRPLTLVANSKY